MISSAFNMNSDRINAYGRWTLCLVAAVGLLAVVTAPLYISPAEDAVILFQYSANLAKTGIISYITGGPPAEGATDFLWMVMLAAARWIGLDPFVTTAFLNIVAILATAFLLLKIADASPTWRNLLPIIGIIMLTRQVLAGMAGFSVLPFGALLVAMTFCYLPQGSPHFQAVHSPA